MAEILKQISFSEEYCYLELGKQTPQAEELVLASESFSEEVKQEQAKAREEAYRQGFAQGMVDGLVQAEQQATNQANELVEQLNHLLESIPAALNESRRELKTEIADIVLAISQQFFIHQQQNKEAIAQQISATLNHLNDKQAITLALNPQDLALLQKGELAIDFSQCKDLRINADESLSLGGCRIKTEHGIFDASIERQIDCLKQALLQIKKRYSHG